jgi:phosphate uptake regulator
MDKQHFGQHSSSQFNEELESIRDHMMEMGGLVEQQVGEALNSRSPSTRSVPGYWRCVSPPPVICA